MKNLLINLVSDQTIPNVKFIMEFKVENDTVLFVTTEAMDKKGVVNWIAAACDLRTENVLSKQVDEYSPEKIKEVLNELNYEEYGKILVNITGGTKIMSLTVYDFFKELGADIYYITGVQNTALKIFPKKRSEDNFPLKFQLSLEKYLTAYGFEVNDKKESLIPDQYTEDFYNWFVKNNNSETQNLLNTLRTIRDTKTSSICKIDGLSEFIDTCKFPISDPLKIKINKSEIGYLTGEWLEKYVFNKLKQELNINKDIRSGITLTKATTPNEFDIVLLIKGQLFAIECKTSILSEETGKGQKNIITETIYKSASLQKNLGLFSKFSILTLSKREEIRKNGFDRAQLFDIRVIGLEDITGADSFARLLGIC